MGTVKTKHYGTRRQPWSGMGRERLRKEGRYSTVGVLVGGGEHPKLSGSSKRENN
jgi:hypothetical protein